MARVDTLPGGPQPPILIYDRIAANKRETWLMMIVFVVLIGGLATVFEYAFGMPLIATPFILAGLAAYAAVSYYPSAAVALGVSGAREVTRNDEPELYRIVE